MSLRKFWGLFGTAVVLGAMVLAGCDGGTGDGNAPGDDTDDNTPTTTKVLVPNVIGMSEANARSALVAIGLKVGTITQANSNAVPDNAVCKQVPAAGLKLTTGTAVNLVLAINHDLNPGDDDTVTVPNVATLKEAAARSAITEAELTVGTITYQTSTAFGPGCVISQNPAAGAKADKNTAVSLVIADANSTGGGDDPDRWIALDGAVNTRDIGGYVGQAGRKVKWRTVIRSGALNMLSSDGCESLAELGLTGIIDLRAYGEDTPDVSCAQTIGVTVLPVEVNIGDVIPNSIYVQIVTDNADAYYQALVTLGNTHKLPILVHCGTGTDRTGILAALVLSVLGVDRATIMADYTLSQDAGQSINLTWMKTMLDNIQTSGGIETFLAEVVGLSETQCDDLRNALLEEEE